MLEQLLGFFGVNLDVGQFERMFQATYERMFKLYVEYALMITKES